MVLRSLMGALSPGGRCARLSVLIFHRVLPQSDPLFPDEMNAQRFDLVCGWLKSWFIVLPLDEAAAHLKAGTLPARAACITFDDGYADNFHVALPILQRHGLTATFFIATGFLDGGRMWNDTIIETVRRCKDLSVIASEARQSMPPTIEARRAAITTLIKQIKYRPSAERITIAQELARMAKVQLPNDLMMTSDQVKAMRHVGMQIGAHTVSHPILARLADDEARQEIGDSKLFLEELLGERVGLFAYPNGKPDTDYSARHVAMVRQAGFAAALSTAPGAALQTSDLYQLPRFTPWDRSRLRFGVRLLANLRSGPIYTLSLRGPI